MDVQEDLGDVAGDRIARQARVVSGESRREPAGSSAEARTPQLNSRSPGKSSSIRGSWFLAV